MSTLPSAPARPAEPPLRVVIADDSYLIREGLRQLLALAPQVRVVGQCVDAPSLLAAVDAAFSRDQARGVVPVVPDRPLYAAIGASSLLYNGNVWLGEVLLAAGLPFGRWTPTPQSVTFALDWQNG